MIYGVVHVHRNACQTPQNHTVHFNHLHFVIKTQWHTIVDNAKMTFTVHHLILPVCTLAMWAYTAE